MLPVEWSWLKGASRTATNRSSSTPNLPEITMTRGVEVSRWSIVAAPAVGPSFGVVGERKKRGVCFFRSACRCVCSLSFSLPLSLSETPISFLSISFRGGL